MQVWAIGPNMIWLVVSTHLKNISQIGSSPQVGMNIKKYLKPPASDTYPFWPKNVLGSCPWLQIFTFSIYLLNPGSILKICTGTGTKIRLKRLAVIVTGKGNKQRFLFNCRGIVVRSSEIFVIFRYLPSRKSLISPWGCCLAWRYLYHSSKQTFSTSCGKRAI